MFKMWQRWKQRIRRNQSRHQQTVQPSIGQQHAIKASRRRTPRQKTSQSGVVWVTLFDNTRLNVGDLSYGGMALLCEEEKLAPYHNQENVIEMTLHVYHLSMVVEVVPIHGGEGQTGCSFIHSKPDTLLFLRQVLEFIRMGSAVLPTPKEHVKEPYKAPVYHMFHGDRGTELVVRTAGVADVESLEIRFRDGHTDNRVQFSKGSMSYHRYKHGQDDDAFMTLQQGFFILLGFVEKYPHSGFEVVAQTFRAEIDKYLQDRSHRKLSLTAS